VYLVVAATVRPWFDLVIVKPHAVAPLGRAHAACTVYTLADIAAAAIKHVAIALLLAWMPCTLRGNLDLAALHTASACPVTVAVGSHCSWLVHAAFRTGLGLPMES
jgi:uncharacterized protein (DUF2062 family)